MADIKKLIADYTTVNAEHGDSAAVLKKRRESIEKEIQDLRNTLTYPGLKNITAGSGYYDAIVFEIPGVKDVKIRIDKRYNYSNAKDNKVIVEDEFGIRIDRTSFGAFQDITNIFRGDIHSKNVKDASSNGTTEDKMIDALIKVCQIVKTLNTEAFSPKSKLYAALEKWSSLTNDIYAEPVDDVKTAQAAKQKLELSKAAIFEQVRKDIVSELSTKGVKIQSLPQNVLFANVNKHSEAIGELFKGSSKYTNGQQAFTAETIGLSNSRDLGSTNLYPLFWDKSIPSNFECNAFVISKINAKSVSIVANEVKTSELSTERQKGDWNQKFITEYSGRNGNDYVKKEPKGTANIKTATSLERVVAIAIAYNPSLLSKDFIDFYETTKKK